MNDTVEAGQAAEEEKVEEIFPHAQVTVLVNEGRNMLYVQTGDGNSMQSNDPAKIRQVVDAYLEQALGQDSPLQN